jgi:hypothetical protein
MRRTFQRRSCVLCLQDRELQTSHIIPSLCIRPLRDSATGRLMSLRGDKQGVPRYHDQDGPKEPLLCRACEQFRNENYEKPFRDAWYRSGVLDKLGHLGPLPVYRCSDYAAFKLFHLSVLFLAAHATNPKFKVHDIPHDRLESLRVCILNNRAPSARQWALSCYSTRLQDGRIIEYVANPFYSRIDNCEFVALSYAGGVWFTCLAQTATERVAAFSLADDGTMPIGVSDQLPAAIERVHFRSNGQ